MKEKKHIDELFKDRFKNFEASPSPHAWNNIQAKLKEDKEEDRKVIPLWWKLGGVAALLALLLTIGNTVFNPFDTTTDITTEDKTLPEDTETSNDMFTKEVLNTEVVTQENEVDSNKDASEKDTSNTQKTKDKIYKKANTTKNAIATSPSSQKNTVKKTNNTNSFIKKDASVISVKEKEAMAINTEKKSVPEKKTSDKKDELLIKENLIKKEIGIEETTKIEVAEENNIKKETNSTDIQNTETVKEEDEAKKRSILDAINEKDEEAAVAKTTNVPEDRWDVAPNFAPVYYNSLSEGSSIDPSFADNNQSGDVNFSYGVQVSYNINDRLSVRSGVSNVDLSYSTTGLELGTAPVSAALQSVNYGGDRQSVVTALDKGTLAAQASAGNPLDNITPKSTQGEVELIQNINYYEVPLELKYALLNDKFGVNVIGGFSTLFLGNNEVSVQAGDFRDILGEANNLSSISFTTNVGLGFDYKISKKLKFNIEPMFKYQLNPYTDTSVSFKPYYVGIYSGLSFKF